MYERKFMHKDRRDAVVQALDFHPQNQSSIPSDTQMSHWWHPMHQKSTTSHRHIWAYKIRTAWYQKASTTVISSLIYDISNQELLNWCPYKSFNGSCYFHSIIAFFYLIMIIFAGDTLITTNQFFLGKRNPRKMTTTEKLLADLTSQINEVCVERRIAH